MQIAILGFGLLGRLCALQLMGRANLTVFSADDPDMPQGAGAVAAAMLAPLAEAVHCAEPQLLSLGRESMVLWPMLLANLPKPVWLQQSGTLVVSHHADDALLAEFQQRTSRYQDQANPWLNRPEIAQLEPDLPGHFRRALWLSGEGQLDNRSFYRASLQACQQAGVTLYWQTAMDNLSAQQWASEWTRGRLAGQAFDAVLDCRGLGARKTLALRPAVAMAHQRESPQVQRNLRGVRGEIIRVSAPDVQLTRPVRFMHPRYPLYIAPKPEQQFVIGATEIDSQDDSPISLQSSMALLSAAYALHPGFAEARILNARTGLRPAFSHHLPAIYRHGRYFSLNGLFRHGYLLGPLFSKALTAMVLGHAIPESVAPFITDCNQES
ncbi:FAD-dependent oxidoreductase [Planctobacterium marinum]|uniref:FAD-dependent oxidoreductase n=1 Tax=Planctobacterium marinum TaxID=1631968 RepID=UPI001E65C1E3|nr:FAD-dependent oxidoreductase [Planctobacterium marinum]MCC2607151.1 FAD-binding oxidoreductase [Planctobacterium marinum]